MTYCDNQALREECIALTAPAPPIKVRTPVSGTQQGDGRDPRAASRTGATAGLENYAFKSLATKMAENPQQVWIS